jgi:hypothetical protein
VRARATVRLPVHCDNRCVFCGQEGLDPVARPVAEQLEAARARTDEVTFVGGEPTLDPGLPQAIEAARALGFVRIGIQTHGRGLSEPALVSALAGRGLTDVHLSIHGGDARVHDYHTGIDGSFSLAVAALAAARGTGLTVVVATVLTRSNFRCLAPMPSLLASRGASGWLVAVPAVAGRARDSFDRVVPRLGLALPFALNALDAAEALGLEVRIAGAPRCLLGSYSRWRMVEPPRAFAAACDGCAARSTCTGLDQGYLARFEGDEVASARARMGDDSTDPPRDTMVARMFVGSGELAVDATGPRPRSRRVALPLAEKARPARAEATAASPRRSGEALRDLFPGLFEDGPGAKG